MRSSRDIGVVVLLLVGFSGCAGVSQRGRSSSPTEAPLTNLPTQSSQGEGWSWWRKPASPAPELPVETSRRGSPETNIWPDRGGGLSRLLPSTSALKSAFGNEPQAMRRRESTRKPTQTAKMTAAEANLAIARVTRSRKSDSLVLAVHGWGEADELESPSRPSAGDRPTKLDEPAELDEPTMLSVPIPLPGSLSDEPREQATAPAVLAEASTPKASESEPSLDAPVAKAALAAQLPPAPPVRTPPRTSPPHAEPVNPPEAEAPAAKPIEEAPKPAEPPAKPAEPPAEPAKPIEPVKPAEAPEAVRPVTPPTPEPAAKPRAVEPQKTEAPKPTPPPASPAHEAAAPPPSARDSYLAAMAAGSPQMDQPSPTYVAAAPLYSHSHEESEAPRRWAFWNWGRSRTASIQASAQAPAQLPPPMFPASYDSIAARPLVPCPDYARVVTPTAQQPIILPSGQGVAETVAGKKSCALTAKLHEKLERFRTWKNEHICRHIQSFKAALKGGKCTTCRGHVEAAAYQPQASPQGSPVLATSQFGLY